MQGYPKTIATRQDVANAMEIDAERTKAFLSRAIEHRDGWHVTARLAGEHQGFTDDTHRVVNLGDEEDEQWYEETFGPLPGNTLDRIGITVAQAQALIDGGA